MGKCQVPHTGCQKCSGKVVHGVLTLHMASLLKERLMIMDSLKREGGGSRKDFESRKKKLKSMHTFPP